MKRTHKELSISVALVEDGAGMLIFAAKGNPEAQKGIKCLRDLLVTAAKMREEYKKH